MSDSSLDVRQYITFLMSALATRGNRLLEEYLDPYGISPSCFYILSLIVSSKGEQMSQKNVAEKLLMNVNTVTRHLDDLERKGLARRVVNPDNRKENLIEVTHEGQTCIRKAHDNIGSLRQRVFEIIPVREFEQLRRTLLKLYLSDLMNDDLPTQGDT